MEGSLQEEIQKGLSEVYKNTQIDDMGVGSIDMALPNNTSEQQSETKVPDTSDNSSLNNETPPEIKEPVNIPIETITNDLVVSEPVITKSFEELLAEKTAGKFKSWDEVENVVNTPKEEFANDEIKRLNELAKKGVKLDKDFFELQSKDFESMTNPLDIMKEAMQRKPEYQGLSQKALDFEMNKKYNLKEWIDKDNSDLTDEDEYHRELLLRDADNNRDWLTAYKNERILSKEPDPEQLKLASDQKDREQQNWERFVDEELANKVSKLSTKIDDKESIDYEVSREDAKYASDIMKSMTKDINVFWNQFADKDGEIDQKAVFEAILFLKNKGNIVKIAHQNALAKGAEAEIKTIKNTSFEPNATPSVTKVDWSLKAQQDIEKHL